MNSRFIKITVFLVCVIGSVFITLSFLRQTFTAPLDPNQTKIEIFEIAQGKGLTQIAQELRDRALIRSVFGMKMLAKLLYDSATVKAGEYELSASMTPKEILKKLISGDIIKRRVLVKEGATVWEIAQALDQAGVVTKSDFLHEVTDAGFLKKAGITAPSFEGYLFPETYFFSRPITSQEVIWQMFELAEKKWTEEYSNQMEALSLTRHDILTLASMIQKESASEDEMPLVSSVFHNRMKQGMKMQCDPTVIYGIPNFNGNLTKEDLETDHPYNTYTRYGLPIGPISNPGEKAIRAALFPRASNYLYFVGDGKGRHVFSENLKDHNQAVQEYQIKPNLK
jgi:UPF0755 protein